MINTKDNFKFLYGGIRNAIERKDIRSLHWLARNHSRKMFNAVDYAIDKPVDKATLDERLWRYKSTRKLVNKKRRY